MTDEHAHWPGDLDEIFKQEEEPQEIPPDEVIHTLSDLAVQYEEITRQIAENEAQHSKLSKQLDRIRTDLIPERMMQFGVRKFELDDGSVLSYQPFYKGSPLKGEESFAWLEKSGYAGAVKQELKLEVSRIDKSILEQIKKSIAMMKSENLSAKEKVSIHHMTMSSILKELSMQGKDLPKDLFDTYIGNIATLKRKSNGQSSSEI